MTFATKFKVQRSVHKSVRVATHVPVLEFCFSKFDIEHVIEHGMGIASTPYFHSAKNVASILSFEDDPRWQRCEKCGDGKKHDICTFSELKIEETLLAIDVKKTLALIDGPTVQRDASIDLLMRRSVPLIVEHDSESFTDEQFASRKASCVEHGYHVYEYAKLNPETVLYAPKSFEITFEDLVRVELS